MTENLPRLLRKLGYRLRQGIFTGWWVEGKDGIIVWDAPHGNGRFKDARTAIRKAVRTINAACELDIEDRPVWFL